MRTVVQDQCPSCSKDIQYLYQTQDIPYFSEILVISASCQHCGYRYVDTQILKSADPSRFELLVQTTEDLGIRVIRSMTGTVKIPELGVQIDPGPACQGFVSNVEGVLDRIEHVVRAALLWTEGEEKTNASLLLEQIVQARQGKLPFTLILEDSAGNSAIISDKARKKPLDISQENC